MNYKVDFNALDTLYYTISNQCAIWNDELGKVQEATKALCTSKNMSGMASDNIRAYFESVFGTILSALSEILQAHNYNCLLYKQDYQTNIDSDLHAIICSEELENIKVKIQAFTIRTESVEDNVKTALNKVQDIFPLRLHGTDYVFGAQDSVKSFIETLDQKIVALEERHFSQDFDATERAIVSLKAFIQEQYSKERDYKADFSVVKLANSQALQQLYQDCQILGRECQEKELLIGQAVENENARVADLQTEYEAYKEREEQMKAVKWIVTGVCVIGSIAAIAATGGAATPLVVGAVSAVSGAVIAGTNNLADQYTMTGDFGETNWVSFGTDAIIGGISGFITGCVGAGVSSAVTSGLSNTAVGASLLNSSNALVRIGTGAAIGSVSEVSSGIASRGATTLVITGNLDEAKDAAFNLKNIVFDATIGGVSGGVNAAKNPIGREIEMDDFDDELLKTKPNNSPNPEKWLENGGKIHVDGNNTWTYTSADGVTVCYTNGYPDFKRAGLVETEADIGGFSNDRTVDFRKANMKATKSATSTWHHSEDGHTLQAVPTKYHKMFTHRGGFSLVQGG